MTHRNSFRRLDSHPFLGIATPWICQWRGMPGWSPIVQTPIHEAAASLSHAHLFLHTAPQSLPSGSTSATCHRWIPNLPTSTVTYDLDDTLAIDLPNTPPSTMAIAACIRVGLANPTTPSHLHPVCGVLHQENTLRSIKTCIRRWLL